MKDRQDMTGRSDSILYESIMALMPQFVLHVEPIVHQSRFRGMRMRENHVKVMMLLHHTGKASPGFITHHLNIQKGSLTAVLRNLRHKGLIEREALENDERSYRVFITETGEEFVTEHMAVCEQQIGTVFGEMDSGEKQQVEKGLDILTRYLRSLGGTNA